MQLQGKTTIVVVRLLDPAAIPSVGTLFRERAAARCAASSGP